MVGQPQRRNPTSSTELVANIADTERSVTVSLCTLDGECVSDCQYVSICCMHVYVYSTAHCKLFFAVLGLLTTHNLSSE